MVGIVEHGELAEAEIEASGKRCRLAGDALHHVAVAAHDPGAMVDQRQIGAVEAGRQHALGERHADGVGEALAERARRDLDARRLAALGMARRARAPLAELLEVLDREVVAGQMQRRVQHHRGMAGRQHEAVAIRPVRVRRVVPEVARVEAVHQRRQAHRRAGMARVGALHGVDRQEPRGIDRIALDPARRRLVRRAMHHDEIGARAVCGRVIDHRVLLPIPAECFAGRAAETAVTPKLCDPALLRRRDGPPSIPQDGWRRESGTLPVRRHKASDRRSAPMGWPRSRSALGSYAST